MALINLRNALMTGKRLPYDAEVEYLGGGSVDGGIAFVDTGYMPNSSTRIEATAAMLTGSAYSGRYGNGARLTFGSGNNQLYSAQGGHYFFGSFTTGRYYSFVNDIQNRTVSVDGATPTSTSAVANWYSQSYPFYLFVSNVAPTSGSIVIAGHSIDPNSVGGMRIASCRIYDNNILVRDYIPVRKGTVGYLYDRVSGKLFGNAGTGDFVVGPDVVPVEWIESHGTEYLNIPASGTPDEYFGIKGLVKITNTSQRNKAVWDTETNRQFGACGYDMSGASYVFASWVGAKNTSGGWFVSPGVLYPFEVSTLGKTLNGEFQSLPRNITSAFSTLRLFGKYGTAEYGGNASVAFGALTIADGTGNARNFSPVRVGTDATSWKGAMMDVLTRRIYRNAGTGAFTYGNDLKYPIPAE